MVNIFLMLVVLSMNGISSYECGFIPLGDSRNVFEILYNIIAI